jgi:hypothetical protein
MRPAWARRLRAAQQGDAVTRTACLSSFIVAFAVAGPGVSRAEPGADAPVRRYALIASASDGGPQRATLRFADGDALAMAGVLRRLGGLQDSDVVLLTGARRDTLEASFAWLRAAMRKAEGRRELVVYYAGHSDDKGLLLGGDRVSYRELTDWIESTSADVRIAILDRCGARSPASRPDALAAGRGRAFLTASAPDRGGASFTRALVSGMRGAADISRDGRVTLAEAYRFARGETLRADRAAPGDVELGGDGDLVLTYLRSSTGSLILDAQLAGGVAVSDLSGKVVLELRKQAAYPVELGLDPGSYEVSLVRDGRSYVAQVALDDGAPVRLGSAQFAAAGRPISGAERRPTVAAASSPAGRHFGVYAGLGTRYTRLAGAGGFLIAPEAGFLLDRRLALGLQAGAGWSDGDGDRTRLGYALLFARYHFRCDSSIVCLSLAAAGGPGAVDGGGSDAVLLFEPQLGVHLMATRFLRFGADLGYRLVASADDDAGHLRGVSTGLNIQLGWF